MSTPRARFALALGGMLVWGTAGLISSPTATAQITPGVGTAVVVNNIGGVYVSPDGVLENTTADTLGKLRELRRQALEQIDGDLQQSSPLRKVSLARLEAALAKALAEKSPLPDEIQFLAGLQRIHYVFVLPEQHDVVLAGPAEGWKVDGSGEIVGAATGRPVMLLDDLLVALRATHSAAPAVIACSIDPTPEGTRRLQDLFASLGPLGERPKQTLRAIEEALGPQIITIHGVPETSHFARVLVAADYRMKRLAMNLEKPPLTGMPGYLTLVKSSTAPEATAMPRWWLAPKYEPLLRDGEGLAWELRGASVQAMTEDDFISATGQRQATGRQSPLAQRWADSFTENFPALAQRIAVFGQLQNLMDLAIVGALIQRHGLAERAGLGLSLLADAQRLPALELPAPRQVSSQASLVSRKRDYVVSASGGVEVNPWAELERTQTGEAPSLARQQVQAPAGDRWWWD